MAKKFPFTRTISKQNVIALVFDKETAEVFNTNVIITPPITDPDKLEKAVAKQIDSDALKFIQIVDVSVDEKVYGVTMEDFMSIAVELDPKTRNLPTTDNTNA